MKVCPKCQNEFEPKRYKAMGQMYETRFCSRKCANSHVRTAESKAKTSRSMKASNAALTPEQRRKRFHTEAKRRHYETHVLAMQIINRTRIELMTTQEMKSSDARRRRVLHQQDGKCKRCGLDEWRGEPLTLELEHKDGNRDNNRRENLECLCPNCHSLTLTWRGRKNQGRIGMTKPIPVEGHPSISAYQRTQGRTPKGAAFARIRKKLASGELKP